MEGPNSKNVPSASGIYGSLQEDPQVHNCGIDNKQNLRSSEVTHITKDMLVVRRNCHALEVKWMHMNLLFLNLKKHSKIKKHVSLSVGLYRDIQGNEFSCINSLTQETQFYLNNIYQYPDIDKDPKF